MARDEAKVRVRLDTKSAKGELRGFVRDAEKTSRRVAGGVRKAVGRGLGAVGLGAGVGAGIAAVRGATESGIGDVIGESLGGIGHQIAEFFLGDLDEKARASKSAREETISAFSHLTRGGTVIPPGAKNFFENVKSIRMEEEMGRTLFEDPKSGFRGPGADELLKRIMAGLESLLNSAVDYLISKIPVIGGGK